MQMYNFANRSIGQGKDSICINILAVQNIHFSHWILSFLSEFSCFSHDETLWFLSHVSICSEINESDLSAAPLNLFQEHLSWGWSLFLLVFISQGLGDAVQTLMVSE